ncbi:hypothetical protein BD289DRAFT_450197 [Coniella lustricola]|uniref:Putative transcription factor kapC n=1 Tax=Coniella lustricola TaxID=2025994 RepID=A0A2T3AJ65_9PEZI|nr:hypothetical protein BD289DRAFT_450197 [Coniella lustricola]
MSLTFCETICLPTPNGNGARPQPKLIPRPQPLHVETAPVPQPHGYTEPVTPPVSAPVLDPELSLHPSLRSPGYAPTANMMSTGGPAPPEQHPQQHPGAIPGPVNSAGVVSPIDPNAEGRKAKRELSNSKRAAQNRAAQRAFRQRKEGYIKKLEQQVRDYGEMENQFKMLQSENYSLREYVLHLQSRLVDAQIEPPQPPPNVNLNNLNTAPGVPGPPPPHGLPQPEPEAVGSPPAEPTPNTGSATGAATLDAVAQAVQSLSRETGFKPEVDSQAAEDQRTAEEISRQLAQAESVPAANM